MSYGLFIAPFTLIVLVLAHGKNLLSPLLDHPWVVLLGEASFSLFIIHIIPFMAMKYYQEANGVVFNPLVTVAVIVATIVVSVLVYRYVEVPARKMLRGKQKNTAPQATVVPLG